VTITGMLNTRYLIVGNSAGGIGAAEAIRERDKSGSVTLVSDEPYPSYSRPLIAKYLARESTPEKMLFRPVDFYAQNNITPLLGKRVRSLGLEKHVAELESGERIAWEKLLIATGGTPIIPRIKGIDKIGVFNFFTLDDAKAIDEFLDNVSKVVVIGGGLIGVSAAEALIRRGAGVTVVEMKDRILNTILDDEASSMVEAALRKAGVRVITNHTVAEVMGGERVTGAILDNGEEISCHLVIMAIGVLPRIELVHGSGIKVNRGILVDRSMTTNHPDVYACGDVAESYDFIYGTNRLVAIWPNAYIGGRTAGQNMAGIKAEYPDSTAINSLNYFGLDIAAAGIVVPPNSNGYEVLSEKNGSIYQKLVLKDNLIVGMICVGNVEKSGIIFGLMRDRVNVGDFKQALFAEDFGLISLPRELWQKRLGTPPLQQISLLASQAEAEEDFAGE
jgi:NAD(P)H-nitrite reductase large subunit